MTIRRTLLAALMAAAALPALAQAPDAARVQQLRSELHKRFGAADTDHDGRLTRAEAQAGMPRVARNFDAIDTGRTGAVTLGQIEAYAASQRGRRPAAD